MPINEDVPQHPRVTIGWAVAGLETAIVNLSDGPAERRVRAQFHQLLLALERARLPTDLQPAEISSRHGHRAAAADGADGAAVGD